LNQEATDQLARVVIVVDHQNLEPLEARHAQRRQGTGQRASGKQRQVGVL
jgi:hypothetical protein